MSGLVLNAADARSWISYIEEAKTSAEHTERTAKLISWLHAYGATNDATCELARANLYFRQAS